MLMQDYLMCDSSGVETHKLRTTVIKSLTKMEKIDTTDINMGILLARKKCQENNTYFWGMLCPINICDYELN